MKKISIEYLTTEAERRYKKKYYQQHREVILQRKREEYAENREKYREKNKSYAMTHDRSQYFKELHRKKVEEMGVHADKIKYTDGERREIEEKWEEYIGRLKRSGFDLSRIIIIPTEREGKPLKRAVRG